MHHSRLKLQPVGAFTVPTQLDAKRILLSSDFGLLRQPEPNMIYASSINQ
jgi:hypothetical protein